MAHEPCRDLVIIVDNYMLAQTQSNGGLTMAISGMAIKNDRYLTLLVI